MIKFINSRRFLDIFNASFNWVNLNRKELDDLNIFPVPDGDTGFNMVKTLTPAVEILPDLEGKSLREAASSVADIVLPVSRGNSGVIIARFLKGFAKGVENKNRVKAETLPEIFKIARDFAYSAMKNPVEGTMLTVIDSANCTINELVQSGERDLKKILSKTVKKMRKTLEKTPDMLPILKKAGVVDSGALAFVYMLEGIERLIKGLSTERVRFYIIGRIKKHLRYLKKSVTRMFSSIIKGKEGEDVWEQELKFRFCTEFTVSGTDFNEKGLEDKIVSLGDSFSLVSSEEIYKVHIHTNEPETVLKKAKGYGDVENVKIDDMVKQQEDFVKSKIRIEREQAILAISPGKGFDSILKSLGVSDIIRAKKHLPTTGEIVKNINRSRARFVLLFTNDKNVIPSAEQAKEKTPATLFIIPSKNIIEGINALLTLNPESTPEANRDTMTENLELSGTLFIACAVKNRKFGEIFIRKGDFFCIHNGNVLYSARNCNETIVESIKKIYSNEMSLITGYTSKKRNEPELKELEEKIKAEFPDIEIEWHYGGQKRYELILSIE